MLSTTFKQSKNFYEILILILLTFSPLIPMVLKLLITIFLIIKNVKYINKFNNSQAFLLFGYLSVFLIGAVKDIFESQTISDFSPLNIFFPSTILLGALIAAKYKYNKEYLFDVIERISFFAAITSIIGYAIYTLYPGITTYLITYHYYQTSHKTAILFNVLISEGGYIIKRNTGLASEPGLFQLLVNFGLYFYLKNTDKPNILKLFIYFITIISTASTAGLIIFIIIILRTLINNLKTALTLIVVLLILSPVVYEQFIYQTESKLLGSYAFETRYNPLISTLKIAKENFLGLGNTGYNNYFIGSIQPGFDSYSQVFIRYGYPLLIILTISLINIALRDRISFFILLITFTAQGVWSTPFISLFYFIFLQREQYLKSNGNHPRR